MKNICFYVFIILFFLISTLMLTPSVYGEARIAIIQYSDLHGQLEPLIKGKMAFIGGITYLADYINFLKEIAQLQGYSKIFVVNDGDIFQKSPYGSIFRGDATIDILNSTPLDILVPGNHEFDLDMDFVEKLPSRIKAQVICANLYSTKTKKRIYPPLLKKKISSNSSLYFIGFTAPETNNLKSPRLKGKIFFTPLEEEFSKLIKEYNLKSQDIIILLAHEEKEKLKKLAQTFPGLIDIIFGGHDHDVYNVLQNNIPIINSGKYGMFLSLCQMNFQQGKLRFYKNRTIPIGDRKIAKKLFKWRKKLNKVTEQVIIKNNPSKLSSKGDNDGPVPLTSLVAYIFKKKAKVQIGCINAGGVREKLPRGKVTLRHILTIFPYENYLCKFYLNGKQLKNLVYQSFKKLGKNGFLHFSGLKIFTHQGKVTQILDEENHPLKDDKMYSLATTDFLLEGGDGYSLLKGIPYEKIETVPTILKEFFSHNPPPYPFPEWLIER